MTIDVLNQPRPKAVFRKGYAICSPSNNLQADSFAKSEKKAIKRHFGKKGWKKVWMEAEGEGWTVKLVYMRLFVPVFYSSFNGNEADVSFDEDDEIAPGN